MRHVAVTRAIPATPDAMFARYADNGDLNDFGGNDFDDDDNFV